MKTSIYIATHKKANFPNKSEYIPIQAGAELKDNLGFFRDDVGDNISVKNPSFCELTILYWIWKNDESDIVGLVHYRRYFYEKKYSNTLNNVIGKKKIEKILTKYDMILPRKEYIYKFNLMEQWNHIHNSRDIEICKKIIKEKYPEYLNSFDKVFSKNSFYAFNMFIAKKSVIDDYCKWLFDILFEMEKLIDISSYSDYNKRLFGFISERLFNVWIEKNNHIKIKEMMVLQTDKNNVKQRLLYTTKKYSTCVKNFLEKDS